MIDNVSVHCYLLSNQTFKKKIVSLKLEKSLQTCLILDILTKQLVDYLFNYSKINDCSTLLT